MSADTPVNEVRLSDSNLQLVVDECVICGGTHRHGSMDATVARGGRSHRVAHCTPRDADSDAPGGYDIELADDAERRESWLNQALPGEEIETCRDCGAALVPDDDGEYRHRVVLEDLARSSGSRLEVKLCTGCWWALLDELSGGAA